MSSIDAWVQQVNSSEHILTGLIIKHKLVTRLVWMFVHCCAHFRHCLLKTHIVGKEFELTLCCLIMLSLSLTITHFFWEAINNQTQGLKDSNPSDCIHPFWYSNRGFAWIWFKHILFHFHMKRDWAGHWCCYSPLSTIVTHVFKYTFMQLNNTFTQMSPV